MRIFRMTLLIALILPASAFAHELRPSVADITFTQGTFTVELQVTLEALIAEVDPNLSDTSESENAARYDTLRAMEPDILADAFIAYQGTFLSAITANIGEHAQPLTVRAVAIPEVGNLDLIRDSVVTITGDIPAKAETLTFGWDEQFGPLILRVTTIEGVDGYAAYLRGGQLSDAISLDGVTRQSRMSVLADYIAIGFTHIVPKGLDHILFVVGLFLLSSSMRPLMWQVSAFTLAHTISLGLGMLGWVKISPSIVEPLIAASIVYVCVENIFRRDLSHWRPLVVFGFGLLHGLGFAGVLLEVGFVQSEFISSLIGFNIGVELGQLTIIALCFALIGAWFGRKAWYRGVITVPLSIGIAAIGAFWFFERVFFQS